jgi:hypothetical protein
MFDEDGRDGGVNLNLVEVCPDLLDKAAPLGLWW